MRLAFAVVLAVSLGLTADARAASPLPANGRINTPGDYYLTGNRLGSGVNGALININVSNVSLDLNGFVVRCEPPDPATAVSIGIMATNLNYITIRNGNITGCYIGSYGDGTHNLTIENVDYSRNTYIGHNGAGSHALFRGNVFANITGYANEAYSVGISNPGNACRVEQNVFQNLHRQPSYLGSDGGEGVAILHTSGTTGCVDRYNWMKNDAPGDPNNLDIGVWVGTYGSAWVEDNTVIGFARALFSYPNGESTLSAVGNKLFLEAPVTGSIAISSQHGMTANNFMRGFVTSIQGGMIDGGGNVILP